MKKIEVANDTQVVLPVFNNKSKTGRRTLQEKCNALGWEFTYSGAQNKYFIRHRLNFSGERAHKVTIMSYFDHDNLNYEIDEIK